MDPPPSAFEALTTTPPAVGTFLKTGSATMVEALGTTALDCLLVDRQHALADFETVEAAARAADLHGVPLLARLGGTGPGEVNSLLDAGVSGLIIPQVDGPEAVAAVADAARYSGSRSFAGSTRAGRFGTVDPAAYRAYVEEELAFLPQIETEAGLEAVEAIAASPATTGLMIGPADLSLSIGVERGDEAFEAAVDRIFAAALDHDVGVGTFVSEPAALERYADRGATFLFYGSDVDLAIAQLDGVLPLSD